MVSVSSAAGRVKLDPQRFLSRECVRDACVRAGHRFRCRVLDPFTTIAAMLLQVMHGYTSLAGVARLMHGEFCESALCQARSRLPLRVLLLLLERMSHATRGVLDDHATPGRWRGLRTLLIDGTGFSMPDSLQLRRFFGYAPHQKHGCGFPIGHLVAVFDATTGLILDMIASARTTGEMTLTACLHAYLRAGDLLIGDAQFDSYAHLATLQTQGIQGLFRLRGWRADSKWARSGRRRKRQRDRHGNYRPQPLLARHISADDRIVEWPRPWLRARWQTQEQHERQPARMLVRVLRVRIESAAFRPSRILLVTTLLDPVAYPADEIARLYLQRWNVELNMRHLKRTMGMDVLRCKSVEGVRKELAVFALAYNLVRLVMLQAAEQQHVAPDRISFVDALRWLSQRPPDHPHHPDRTHHPDEPIPILKINPLRPNRHEPRARKRRTPRTYPILTRPRHLVKQYLTSLKARLI